MKIEAHRYSLLKGMEERVSPSMMSAHGSNNEGQYGETVSENVVAYLLEQTQPAALTGSSSRGAYGFEKLQKHYEDVYTGENRPARRNLSQSIKRGEYVVGTAVHSPVGLVKSKSSSPLLQSAVRSRVPEQPRAAWIETIAVVPEAVGKGIGSALLHDALGNYPDEAQVVCEVLGPFDGNPIGSWLEDKLGFDLDREDTRVFWKDTVGVSFYVAESVGLVRAALEDSGKIALLEEPAKV